MPIQKPTLSEPEMKRNQKLIADLIFQLKRAKEIREPIHIEPFKVQKEGQMRCYEYNRLIRELKSLSSKVAPDPFFKYPWSNRLSLNPSLIKIYAVPLVPQRKY
jgi:hypothetical protein